MSRKLCLFLNRHFCEVPSNLEEKEYCVDLKAPTLKLNRAGSRAKWIDLSAFSNKQTMSE